MTPVENVQEELKRLRAQLDAQTQTANSFFSRNKKTITVSLVAIFVVMIFAAFGFALWKIFEKMNAPQQPFSPAINLSLDGNKSKATDPQVVYVKGENTVTREIAYVQKEIDPATSQKERTDLQMDTSKKDVFVKINGNEYQVPVTVSEDSKFENGKLVVTESTKTDINITGPEPSQWSLSYLRNMKGEQAAGVQYGINKLLKASVMLVEGHDPFIGLSVNLGDLQSRSAPKEAAKAPESAPVASKDTSTKK